MTAERVSEAELHAYVDGWLDPGRSREVAAWIAGSPEAQARVADYRAINDLLHQAYDRVLAEPVPLRRMPGRRLAWPLATAAAALLGVALGWWGRGPGPLPEAAISASLPRQAVYAHAVYTPESRHPVEVTAAEQGHLVAWLSKRLGAEVRIPVLANLGYELVGGRLLPADDRPAAQFMYENAAGRRLTLYVRVFADGAQPTAFQQHRDGDLRVFYWVDGRFGYALTGPVTEAELLGAARLVYHELTPGERL